MTMKSFANIAQWYIKLYWIWLTPDLGRRTRLLKHSFIFSFSTNVSLILFLQKIADSLDTILPINYIPYSSSPQRDQCIWDNMKLFLSKDITFDSNIRRTYYAFLFINVVHTKTKIVNNTLQLLKTTCRLVFFN